MSTGLEQRDVYYEPSGDFTVRGPLLMLGIGCMAAIPLGIAYGYLVLYNPLIYVNFLATLGFGAVLGMAATVGVRKGKVRAPHIAFMDGLLVGVAGVYVAWIVWLHGFLVRAGVHGVWAISPGELWFYVEQIAANGAWSIKGSTPTGMALYAVWGLEALVIIGICAMTCRANAADPFCETCQRWAQPIGSKQRLGVPLDSNAAQQQLESGNIAALAQSGAPADNHFVELSLKRCPQCDALGFLNVDIVTITVDKKKNATTKRTTWISNLLVRDEGLRQAQSLVNPASEIGIALNV
jgi:hypothetical protein